MKNATEKGNIRNTKMTMVSQSPAMDGNHKQPAKCNVGKYFLSVAYLYLKIALFLVLSLNTLDIVVVAYQQF